MTDQPTFQLDADSDGTVTVTLAGEVDLLTVGDLRPALEAALPQETTTVRFDLGAVEFIDSSGLGLIALPLAASHHVVIRNPSPIVRRIIEAVGFAEVLTIEAVSTGASDGG